MSPAWMLYLLERYLRKPGRTLVRWDYPHVFVNPDRTVDQLCADMRNRKTSSISLIGHSFGDWIARSAINQSQLPSIRKLISVCPAAAPVPFAKVFKPILGGVIPELVVMADQERISVPISEQMKTTRSCIWAKIELIVARPEDLQVDHEIWATHLTSVFQPSVWRVIDRELSSH